ncbi:putative transcription factor GRAS family [Rosa chinensis]|uniref:Putative transcription factor GRAS family n=1 Tax=Rosa chinensis TaxID=74649 RepID=A0A2P6QJ01_ROSCH|nr:putative transcription factor GRAS family [Rosa chinensis]
MENSPRDVVDLKLIKNINPNLFIHGITNGIYISPFFAIRFKEALLHYYALFDMFEATIPREDKQRMMFKREIYGNDIMNVIACKGLERFERPDTYKKWQIRNVRTGLKQLPSDQERLKKVKNLSKLMGYHKDFRVEEDGHWMLQGWKGRIIVALSFWIPA